MIGLEFILNLYGFEKLKIAEVLGIHRANITLWLNEDRPIPKKHLERLSGYLNVSSRILQKHVTEEEKRELVKMYIKKLSAQYKINIEIK